METNARGRKIIEQYEHLTPNELAKLERQVLKLIRVPVNPNQFSALVSFASDVGIRGVKISLLLKYLNEGDWRLASLEFENWTMIGKSESEVALKRRRKEKRLFLLPYLVSRLDGA